MSARLGTLTDALTMAYAHALASRRETEMLDDMAWLITIADAAEKVASYRSSIEAQLPDDQMAGTRAALAELDEALGATVLSEIGDKLAALPPEGEA